ncbi:MAG: hypothetical protein LBD58_11375 [Treponema sp.]|nr:hypothetical protein [Treponema sp.]
MRKSFFIQFKKDVVQFNYGDSGKTVYFVVITENGGKQGVQWGKWVRRSYRKGGRIKEKGGVYGILRRICGAA